MAQVQVPCGISPCAGWEPQWRHTSVTVQHSSGKQIWGRHQRAFWTQPAFLFSPTLGRQKQKALREGKKTSKTLWLNVFFHPPSLPSCLEKSPTAQEQEPRRCREELPRDTLEQQRRMNIQLHPALLPSKENKVVLQFGLRRTNAFHAVLTQISVCNTNGLLHSNYFLKSLKKIIMLSIIVLLWSPTNPNSQLNVHALWSNFSLICFNFKDNLSFAS